MVLILPNEIEGILRFVSLKCVFLLGHFLIHFCNIATCWRTRLKYLSLQIPHSLSMVNTPCLDVTVIFSVEFYFPIRVIRNPTRIESFWLGSHHPLGINVLNAHMSRSAHFNLNFSRLAQERFRAFFIFLVSFKIINKINDDDKMV